jgi:hypothetical protein
MQLRYMYTMPMERIIHYFEDMGLLQEMHGHAFFERLFLNIP